MGFIGVGLVKGNTVVPEMAQLLCDIGGTNTVFQKASSNFALPLGLALYLPSLLALAKPSRCRARSLPAQIEQRMR